jgi:D-glycero-alpha-D-manno-heptose-7-phosphate kinase
MIISSCPTRISFSSCDHAPFDKNWGGEAINACIDKRVYCILRRRTEMEEHKFRISYSSTELCNSVNDIKNSLIRECLRFTKTTEPMEVIYLSDTPTKLGLATSSSLVLALLKALFYIKNISVSNEILFDYAYMVERELAGNVGGWQDYICCFGGFNYLTGYSKHVTRIPVKIAPDMVEHLESHCMLIYTGVRADSGVVLSGQLDLLKKGTTLNETIGIKKLVSRIHEILSQEQLVPMDLAAAIRESWELKKKLSDTMTTEHISDIESIVYKVCPDAGIRLVGGGGGRGLLLVIAPPGKHSAISNAVAPLISFPVKFDMGGVEVRRLW